MWNAVVDVGLPRTGTYSFILAAQKAGLKAHHAYVQTVEELGARWYGGVAPAALVAYAALADSPFFLLDVNRTRRAHPGLSFCTTRRRSAAPSMIASRFAAGRSGAARPSSPVGRRPTRGATSRRRRSARTLTTTATRRAEVCRRSRLMPTTAASGAPSARPSRRPPRAAARRRRRRARGRRRTRSCGSGSSRRATTRALERRCGIAARD